jgi:hypothetical protein
MPKVQVVASWQIGVVRRTMYGGCDATGKCDVSVMSSCDRIPGTRRIQQLICHFFTKQKVCRSRSLHFTMLRQEYVGQRKAYHCTNHCAAAQIYAQGAMRPGSSGLFGPGIYFAESPDSARYKAAHDGAGATLSSKPLSTLALPQCSTALHAD